MPSTKNNTLMMFQAPKLCIGQLLRMLLRELAIQIPQACLLESYIITRQIEIAI